MKFLCKEWPTVAWEVLISLLPRQRRSSGTYKPKWLLKVPETNEIKITGQKYWEQISDYALIVQMSKEDQSKLKELISYVESLPQEAFASLLNTLSSPIIVDLPEDERYPFWAALNGKIIKHKNRGNAQWALSNDQLSVLEKTAERLRPNNPFYLHQHLFSGTKLWNYESGVDWEKKRSKLKKQREDAIKDIMDFGGLEMVIRLAQLSEFPELIGSILAESGNEEIDTALLPAYLNSPNKKHQELIKGYVSKRHKILGWWWTNALLNLPWTLEQKATFLCNLPFTLKVWERVSKELVKRKIVLGQNQSKSLFRLR